MGSLPNRFCEDVIKIPIYTHRSLNFFEVHEIVAEYFYLPPWKHHYT